MRLDGSGTLSGEVLAGDMEGSDAGGRVAQEVQWWVEYLRPGLNVLACADPRRLCLVGC